MSDSNPLDLLKDELDNDDVNIHKLNNYKKNLNAFNNIILKYNISI